MERGLAADKHTTGNHATIQLHRDGNLDSKALLCPVKLRVGGKKHAADDCC